MEELKKEEMRPWRSEMTTAANGIWGEKGFVGGVRFLRLHRGRFAFPCQCFLDPLCVMLIWRW